MPGLGALPDLFFIFCFFSPRKHGFGDPRGRAVKIDQVKYREMHLMAHSDPPHSMHFPKWLSTYGAEVIYMYSIPYNEKRCNTHKCLVFI